MSRGTVPKNGLADRYDELHRTPSEAAERAMEFMPVRGDKAVVVSKLRKLSGRLVDLGCGRGEIVLQSPDQFELKVGIDFSEVFLRDAAEFTRRHCSNPDKVQWLLHDLNERIPFPDNYFDAAVSTECIEHTFDVFGLFRETRRILKPGGVFVFSVPNIAYLKHRVRLLLGLQPVTASSMEMWWRDYWDGTHIHYFTLGALKMLLRETGFEFIGNTGSGRLRPIRLVRPTLLCGDLIVTARKK